MILVDTNVISEALKPRPNDTVMRWLEGQKAETLYLSSVSLAESLVGIAVLPEGKRKRKLRSGLDRQLKRFGDRILPFNGEAARCYSELYLLARQAGRGFPTPDAYIAAIAAVRGFAVATRDVAPYTVVGVRVINPWDSAASPG